MEDLEFFYMNKKYSMIKNFGFTLIEMSITILILSILMVGGINFQIKLTNNSRENITANKLKTIENALNEYMLKYRRLPCPAGLLVSDSNSDYGKELRNNGCYAEDSSFINENIIYGAIPNRTLGLTDDYGVDGWKNRIIYVVDKNYGESKTFLSSGNKAITIQNLNADTLTDRAVYVLLSGGENENGMFKNGIQKNINNSLKDSINSFKNDFSKVFVKDIKNDSYDDIVHYRTKKDFAYKLDLQDMPCNLKDLALLDSDWDYASNSLCQNGICKNGTILPSKNGCPSVSNYSKNPDIDADTDSYNPVRRCLKYGEWSDIIYPCGEGCGESNIASITGGGFASSNQLRNAIDINYLKRAKKGEEITLECINNDMVGYITLLCKDNGTWEYRNGSCVNSNKAISF